MSDKYEPATDPRGFAIWAHGPQQYGPGVPYVQHLDEVVGVVREFASLLESEDIPVLETAGWLHDVVEDTTIRVQVIHELFGTAVGGIVYSVTNEPGINRKERNKLTYPKIRRNRLAVFLKLCDRLANVRASVRTRSPQLTMYMKEHAAFSEALYTIGQFEPLWDELQGLLR